MNIFNLTSFPTESVTALTFSGKTGKIEARATSPDKNPQNKAILICHPHPLMEGTMNNKVVTTLVRAFNEKGFHTLIFNFRGVGQSEGQHDNGIGEAEDTAMLLDWLHHVLPEASLYLAGFSFGAYVAYRVATSPIQHQYLKGLLLVAPPVFYPQFAELPNLTIPWVLVQGENDEVVDADEVFAWAEKQRQKPMILRFSETSHFFHGKLVELKQALQQIFL